MMCGRKTGLKPIAHSTKCLVDLVPVSSNVLSCYIGTEHVKPIPITIQNETRFAALRSSTKFACSEEEAEFQRHVETRQSMGAV